MALPVRRSSAFPARWEPFRELDALTERMRSVLDETFGGTAAGGDTGIWTPLVDIEETDDAYILEADLPGVRREDVNVELVGADLVDSGEVKEKERRGAMRVRTRRTGRFEYRVSLPADIDAEKIDHGPPTSPERDGALQAGRRARSTATDQRDCAPASSSGPRSSAGPCGPRL